MGAAYTSGLQVTASTILHRTRRLPLKGDVVVREGERVEPSTVVARAAIPGILRTVRASEILGVDPEEIPRLCRVAPGARVTAGELLASTSSFWGLFRAECRAPVDGHVELVNPVTGHISIRDLPRPVEMDAYVSGEVERVLPEEGVVVRTRGALVQGIFGVGGERLGRLQTVAPSPEAVLTAASFSPELRGCVVVCGAGIDAGGLQRAAEVGAAGVITGAIIDRDLVGYIGFDIGVAITGGEKIPFTLILTEGFGRIPMAARTFNLLRELNGRMTSINGATQIRAGVIRPEIIVPRDDLPPVSQELSGGELVPGASIRVIREPYFGILGKVTAMPPEPQRIPTGAMTRVLEAELADGRRVIVPRANVEIVAG